MRRQPVNRIPSVACLGPGLLFGLASVAAAQPTEPPPAEPPATETAAAEGQAPKQDDGAHIGLYVYAAYGAGSADPLNTSLSTAARHRSLNTLELDDWSHGRAELGWQLANNKGDFRVRFNGYKEDSYKYDAVGQAAVMPTGSAQNTVVEPLRWWTMSIQDGALHSERTPPQWVVTDDANADGAIQADEVRYGSPNLVIDRPATDNLQSQVQNIEALYGRVWGGRRFGGRWWAGLRHFEYEGNVLGGAWLNLSEPGEGYTDGTVLRLLNFHQTTEGNGPTGAMEAQFRFFQGHLELYLQGQAAYMLNDLEVDTGRFFTMINIAGSTGNPPFVLTLAQRLTEERDKSSWQTSGEVGARYKLDMGLTFELAWNTTGYLDVVITPSFMQIPTSQSTSGQGVSAVYSTQDLVFENWRFGVGYQF